MRILVTGFPPFPGRPQNPSQRLTEMVDAGLLQRPELTIMTALLPVEYQRVETVYRNVVEQFQPNVVLSFGVGRQESAIQLERRGVNRDDCELPDNAGEIRRGVPILSGSPQENFSSLDLSSLQQKLQEGGVPVKISDDAGAYLCNHLLYFAQSHCQQMLHSPSFLFTHLPAGDPEMSAKHGLRALQILVDWFHNQPELV